MCVDDVDEHTSQGTSDLYSCFPDENHDGIWTEDGRALDD